MAILEIFLAEHKDPITGKSFINYTDNFSSGRFL